MRNFLQATILPAPIGDASEFAGRNGDCGQDVLATLIRIARGWTADTKAIQTYMNTITDDMIRRGWAASNGAATLDKLRLEALVQNASINKVYPYAEPFTVDYINEVFRPLAGKYPILVQTAQGGRMVDAWDSRQHDEPGVRYHVYGIVGKIPDLVDNKGRLVQVGGYICIDGDNTLSNGGEFPVYRLQTLINAQPVGIMVLNMQRPVPKPVPAPKPLPPPVVVPPAVKTYTITQAQLDQLKAANEAALNVLQHV